MRMKLDTRNVSLKEFEKMHRLINGETSYSNAASEEIRSMLVKGVAKVFAIEKVKSEGMEYSKVEVDAILNDPSLNTFDSSKPIVINFSVYPKI